MYCLHLFEQRSGRQKINPKTVKAPLLEGWFGHHGPTLSPVFGGLGRVRFAFCSQPGTGRGWTSGTLKAACCAVIPQCYHGGFHPRTPHDSWGCLMPSVLRAAARRSAALFSIPRPRKRCFLCRYVVERDAFGFWSVTPKVAAPGCCAWTAEILRAPPAVVWQAMPGVLHFLCLEGAIRAAQAQSQDCQTKLAAGDRATYQESDAARLGNAWPAASSGHVAGQRDACSLTPNTRLAYVVVGPRRISCSGEIHCVSECFVFQATVFSFVGVFLDKLL